MARIRSVKPELRTSLTVAAWPREVRYFWVLLWGYLDDHGRGVDDGRLIKADCFPLDEDLDAATMDTWLHLMADGLDPSVCRYSVAGKRYVHAIEWGEHQKPQHPKPSRIPPCPVDHVRRGLHEDLCKPHEDQHHRSGAAAKAKTTPKQGLPAGSPARANAQVNASGDPHEDPTPEQVVGEGDVEEPSSSATAAPRADVEHLCKHLADRIEANGSKRPSVGKAWRDAARLMLDRDGRTEQQVANAINWCQADEFWRGVILSMPKLREKYDQLRLAAQRPVGARASPRPTPTPPPAADVLADLDAQVNGERRNAALSLVADAAGLLKAVPP